MSNYAQQVEDCIWALLEGRTQLAALVRAGNRAKETETGSIREAVARRPADFAQVSVKAGRFTNTGFESHAFFGMEDGSYPGAQAGWLQHRRCDFQIIVTMLDTLGDQMTKLSQVEHEIQAALSADGRSNWGLSFVLMWAPQDAPITAQRKEVVINKQRKPQTTITIPVILELRGGDAILAAAS